MLCVLFPNQWYLWGHETTPQGLVESSRQDEFFGPMLMWWAPLLGKIASAFMAIGLNSTKNCSGVVVGGFLGCNHQKSKRAETTHESHLCKYHCLVHSPSSDKRWAICEAGARIDRIWVLSSTHWAGDSSAPSSGLFLPPTPLLAVTNDDDWSSKWPSPPPRVFVSLACLLFVEIDKPLNSLFASVYSATDDPDAKFVVEALFCLCGFLCV